MSNTELAKPERIPDYSRLDQADIGLALHMRELKMSQTEIAQALHCDQSTISRLFKNLESTVDLARAKLHASASEITEATIEGLKKSARKGRTQDSLEVLDRLDVAPKKTQEKASNVLVQVGVKLDRDGLSPSLT